MLLINIYWVLNYVQSVCFTLKLTIIIPIWKYDKSPYKMSTKTHVGDKRWYFQLRSHLPLLTNMCFFPQEADTTDLASGPQNFHCFFVSSSHGDSDSPSPLPVITNSMHFASWWIEIWGAKCGRGTKLKRLLYRRNLFWGELSVPAVQTVNTSYISYNSCNCFPD